MTIIGLLVAALFVFVLSTLTPVTSETEQRDAASVEPPQVTKAQADGCGKHWFASESAGNVLSSRYLDAAGVRLIWTTRRYLTGTPSSIAGL
jgi:hypothetical protein